VIYFEHCKTSDPHTQDPPPHILCCTMSQCAVSKKMKCLCMLVDRFELLNSGRVMQGLQCMWDVPLLCWKHTQP
jgi:hypothetical protein